MGKPPRVSGQGTTLPMTGVPTIAEDPSSEEATAATVNSEGAVPPATVNPRTVDPRAEEAAAAVVFSPPASEAEVSDADSPTERVNSPTEGVSSPTEGVNSPAGEGAPPQGGCTRQRAQESTSVHIAMPVKRGTTPFAEMLETRSAPLRSPAHRPYAL
eukprot:287425-Prorocentrum_minimum.AAC.1